MSCDHSNSLPDPGRWPSADVVIYDGTCRLCQETAGCLHRLDGHGRLAFLPFQDPRVVQQYPDLSPDDLKKHVYVIDVRGRRHKGAAAARYLTRRLPSLWILAPLLHVPGSMPLWRWLYDQVSRHRHMLDS